MVFGGDDDDYGSGGAGGGDVEKIDLGRCRKKK